MDVDNEMYKYTDKYGSKHEVPRVRVSSLDQIQRGDHICFPRTCYWHHAIVEYIDKSNGEINVIEYSNTARQFSRDNSSPPKRPALAVVVRGRYNLQKDTVYVIKHKKCLDSESAALRAEGRLNERAYNPVTNNCEHFALWCKTEISSSEQVNTVVDTTKDVLTIGTGMLAKHLASRTGQEIVKTGLYREVTKEVVTRTISKTGQEIVKTGARVATTDVMLQTTSKVGQEIVKTAVRATTKEVAIQTVLTTGQEVVKTGVGVATKEVVAQVATNAGQEIAKTGVQVASKEVVTQAASSAGQEMVKTGVRAATKEVVAHAASNGGQEMVKTGVRVATKEVVTETTSKTGQQIIKTGVRVATKDVVTKTASKSGEVIVKTGTRVTTKEVVTQTSSKAGEEVGRQSFPVGLACAVAIEGMFVAKDILSAYSDMRDGRINEAEFEQAAVRRIVTGTASVAGSTIGAAIGQALFPVPVVGGIVGVVGGVVGSFLWKRGAEALAL